MSESRLILDFMTNNKRDLYPLKFAPVAERASWSGSLIENNFGTAFCGKFVEKKVPGLTENLSAVYNTADLGYIDSVVSNGWLLGSSIGEIMETYLDKIVGENVYYFYGRQFPLLSKWLEIKGDTPLLVCPDDIIAGERYDALGKKKFWYVVYAEPGAKIFIGFKKNISAGEFYTSCLDGSIKASLNETPVHEGDSFIIHPGTVHCASGSILIAEISESSNLDFKLSLWRKAVEEDGLDIEEAIDFVDLGKYSSPEPPHQHHDEKFKASEKLAEENEFTITKLSLSDPLHIYTENFSSFLIYTCVSGKAELQLKSEGGERVILNSGEGLVVPAGMQDFILEPKEEGTVLIEASVPKRDFEDSYIDEEAEVSIEGEEACCGHSHDENLDKLIDGHRSCSHKYLN